MTKKINVKRIFSWAMAVIMLLSVMPVSIFAAEPEAEYKTRIIQQPTVNDPRVIVSPAWAVESYQWRRELYGAPVEITQNVDPYTGEPDTEQYSELYYDTTEQVWVAANSYEYLYIPLKEGDIITVVPEGSYGAVWLNSNEPVDADGELVFEPAKDEGICDLMLKDLKAKVYVTSLVSEAVDGETGNTLRSYKMNERYFCRVTFKNGDVIDSDKIIYEARILAQPTLKDFRIDVSSPEDVASYEWYEVTTGKEITNEDSRVDISMTSGEYIPGIGWVGGPYDGQCLDSFYITMNKDEVISVVPNMAVKDFVNYTDGNYTVEDMGAYWTITANEDNTRVMISMRTDDPREIRAFWGEITPADAPLDGQNTDTLTEYGIQKSYVAKVTYKDGTVLVSNILTVSPFILEQPTPEDATVKALPEKDVISYQWYEVGEESDTAVSGADGPTLEALEFGKTYYCVISYGDSLALKSNTVIGKGVFTKQPTVKDPSVEVNYPDNVYYEWWSFAGTEITDETVGVNAVFKNGSYVATLPKYYPTVGWNQPYLSLFAQSGNVILIHASKDIDNISFSSYHNDVTELTDDLWQIQIQEAGEYTVTVHVDWPVTMRVFLIEDASHLEKVAEDVSSLSALELSKFYMCRATFNNGDSIEQSAASNIFGTFPAVASQPTADDPTVKMNYTDSSMTYQWYEAVEELGPITDKYSGVDTSDQYSSAGYGTDGWVISNSEEPLFAIELEKGESLFIEKTNVTEARLKNYYDYYDVVEATAEDIYYKLTATAFGKYEVYANVDATAPVQILGNVYVKDEAIDGETSAALSRVEYGKSYICEISYGDVTVSSAAFTAAPEITAQPTAAAPTVESRFSDEATYQWYEIDPAKEITDSDNAVYSYGKYYADNGWLGHQSTLGIELFRLNMITDETVTFITSKSVNYIFETDSVVGKTVWDFTSEDEGYFFAYLHSGDPSVTVRAFRGSFDELARPIEGETSKTLSSMDMNKFYVCKVTYGDGESIVSYPIGKLQQVISQPTAKDLTFRIGHADGETKYQWYEAEYKFTEITDQSSEVYVDIPNGFTATYDAQTGWNTDGRYSFGISLEEGETVYLKGEDMWEAYLYSFEQDPSQYAYGDEDGEYFVLRAPLDYKYIVSTYVTNFKAYRYEYVKGEAVVGETGKTLTAPERGKIYLCEATYGNGLKLVSEPIEIKPIITSQPTVDDPTVESSFSDEATYQWYEISGQEITPDFADPNVYWESRYNSITYASDIGWKGFYELDSEEVTYLDMSGPDDYGIMVVPSEPVEKVWIKHWSSDHKHFTDMGGVWSYKGDGFEGTLSVKTATPDVTVKVYIYSGDGMMLPVSGETSKTLGNAKLGRSYICKATYGQGEHVIYSGPISYRAKVTQQPTADTRKLAVNFGDDVESYQWYTLGNPESLIGLTDKSEAVYPKSVIPNGYMLEYDPEKGWIMTDDMCFAVAMKAGQKLILTFEQMPDFAGLVNVDTEKFYKGTITDDTTVEITVPVDGNYYLEVGPMWGGAYALRSVHADIENAFHAMLYTPMRLGKAVEGQNTDTITKVTAGEKYLCMVTYKNGDTVLTNSFTATVKEETPKATYDAENKKLTGLLAGAKYEITIDGVPIEVTADANGCIPVEDAWLGKSISVKALAGGEFFVDSDSLAINIPAPPAPDNNEDNIGGEGADGGSDTTGGDSNSNTGNDTADPEATDAPEASEPPAEDGGGLPAGAIVGIVIGSAAVVGGGGAALWWFVFRKKRII